MRKLFLVFLAVAVLNSSGVILSSLVQAAEDTKGTYVVAYYFHGTMRCPTCHKFEQYSREVIETNFKDAFVSGKLEFKVINIEDKGNERFVNDYQLYTKSLVLSLVRDGKEIKWKNLNKIWERVGNKQKFVNYVKSAVAYFLREAK